MMSPRSRLALLIVLLVAIAVALCGPGEARGQSLGPALTPPSWAGATVVAERARAPLAGIAIAFPVGNEADPTGREGALQVAADAVVRAIVAGVGRDAVRGTADVGAGHTLFVFAVRPDRAALLLEHFERIALGTGPAADVVLGVRDDRVGQLAFERDSPLTEVRQQERMLLHGNDAPQARPPGGSMASVASLEIDHVDTVRRGAWRRGEARLALIGPFAEALAAAPFEQEAGAADAPFENADVADAPAVGTSAEAGAPAWSVGERRPVQREVTSAWITVAWPVDSGTPPAVAEFLAHRVRVALNPLPPDPGVFETGVTVESVGGAPAIVVRAAVLPERADAFETTVLGLPERLVQPYADAFFAADLRRFRAAQLLMSAAPEAAARLEALRLLGVSAGDIATGMELDLSADAVTAAAGRLGPARVLVIAPFLQ